MCHQLKLFSVMSPQVCSPVNFCYMLRPLSCPGGRCSSFELGHRYSLVAAVDYESHPFPPNSNRSLLRFTDVSSYFELRVLQVRRDASKNLENEGRISSDPSNVDVHPRVPSKVHEVKFLLFRDETRNISFRKGLSKVHGDKKFILLIFQARRRI